jgi:hypothetical protein
MREQFESLNAQLIEARKAVQERDHILSLMAAIDRHLSERRRELSLLVTQLKYEKQDVSALEGMSLEAFFYTVLGRREEQLEKETAEYLDLKMTTEKCRLTIASLQAQLQQFEEELVILADCDDELEAAKQRQIEFLISLGNSESQRLAELSEKLTESKAVQQQLNGVLVVGRQAVKIIEEILSASADKAVRLAPILQEALDDYQNRLKAISFQYSSPLRAKKSVHHKPNDAFGKVGTSLILAGLVLSLPYWDDLLFLPFSQSDQSKWLLHVRNLRGQIFSKTAVLADRLVWLNDQIDKYQQGMETLMAAMWQPGNFAESEA